MGYIATFTPQAWIRDYAVDVDPSGPTSWRVGPESVGLAAAIVESDADGLDIDDQLKSDPAAPEWVREHHGPFSIHVREEAAPVSVNGRLQPCPQCGSSVDYGYQASSSDPEDVDPVAHCTNPQCDWGY